MEIKKTGLELLRNAFPANQIGKLPKPTKSQTNAVKADFKKGVRCATCGGWHHPKVIHLDYVGHAALTDRLLDCDPRWNWEPYAIDTTGLPLFDGVGGLWIKLTVCGVTRSGYGWADGKTGGDAKKEAIGDALRNAAMRFGAALDLWHKGELHPVEDCNGTSVNEDGKQSEEDNAAEATSVKDELEPLKEIHYANIIKGEGANKFFQFLDSAKKTKKIIGEEMYGEILRHNGIEKANLANTIKLQALIFDDFCAAVKIVKEREK